MDYDEQEVHPGRQDLSTRATGSPSTAPPATSTARPSPPSPPPISGDFGRFMGWADKYRQLQVCTNADTPRDAAAGRRLRRRGHRPVPHRAYVLRRRPHQGHARDDRRRQLWRHRKAALAKLDALSAGRLRGPSTKPWRAARSPSASWIRPCMSSCPPRRRTSQELAKEMGMTVEQLKQRHRRPA